MFLSRERNILEGISQQSIEEKTRSNRSKLKEEGKHGIIGNFTLRWARYIAHMRKKMYIPQVNKPLF
jgi:hypothetical protein